MHQFITAYIKSKQSDQSFQDLMFRSLIFQLRHWEPDCTIHVLTNQKVPKFLGVHEIPTRTWAFNIDKHRCLNLLDQSALFLDYDMILHKPFEQKIFSTNSEYLLYSPSRIFNYERISKVQDGSNTKVRQYNSGMIFVNKPSQTLYNKVTNIHEKYYSDPSTYEHREDDSHWHGSDELALAHYAHITNQSMMPLWEVNLGRKRLELFKQNYPDKTPQSVHYSHWTKDQYYKKELKNWCQTNDVVF